MPPLFEKPPGNSIPPAKDRWTPIFLEHGRLEVDDSSIKWVGADGLVCHLPVATLSCLLLGPGVSVTHAAVKACADSNTPLAWVGEDCLRFYAFGITPTHDNANARLHASAWADKKKHLLIGRRMFKLRFPEIDVNKYSLKELRGMEGIRVRAMYGDLGRRYGVTWKRRDYNTSNWNLSDAINRALSAANASLYAITYAVCASMGFIPSLGFVHAAGTLPFVYDMADLYKHETSFPAAFETVAQSSEYIEERVRIVLKNKIEERRFLQRLPKDLVELFNFDQLT
ncbi:MAG: type I-E CRISPR-associated endonuclease Cas1 [Akkermansia sp.]|nr:type I-E CRISPR-associated endonuclease Cas1 [Akkermansia sp.]